MEILHFCWLCINNNLWWWSNIHSYNIIQCLWLSALSVAIVQIYIYIYSTQWMKFGHLSHCFDVSVIYHYGNKFYVFLIYTDVIFLDNLNIIRPTLDFQWICALLKQFSFYFCSDNQILLMYVRVLLKNERIFYYQCLSDLNSDSVLNSLIFWALYFCWSNFIHVLWLLIAIPFLSL